MINVKWAKTCIEYDRFATEVLSRNLKLYSVSRDPFFPKKKMGKYDIYTGCGYIGFVIIEGVDRDYYLIRFGDFVSDIRKK